MADYHMAQLLLATRSRVRAFVEIRVLPLSHMASPPTLAGDAGHRPRSERLQRPHHGPSLRTSRRPRPGKVCDRPSHQRVNGLQPSLSGQAAGKLHPGTLPRNRV